MNQKEMASRISVLRPVRLRLEVPLEGPYTRVMRRPVPEVEALGQGRTIALVRASRVREPVPLYPALVSCYYSRKGGQHGLVPEDFQDPEWAGPILAAEGGSGQVALNYLAVPVGYVKLPSARWVSALTARLTPWGEKTVEGWRRQIKQSIWLSALRVYAFDPVVVESLPLKGLQPRISPLRVANLQPVLDDTAFEAELDRLLEAVAQLQEYQTDRYSKALTVGPREDTSQNKESPQPAYTLDDFATETGFSPERLQNWEHRLQRKKQVILYGPPGTGKTFVAERLARRLAAGRLGFWELVQFHPSYAYEDFIQGIRPRTEGNTVAYELAEGRFLEFCRRAREVGDDHPCVLVIDEINRAHLSRVFGELMYLLEYRDRAIPLAAGGAPFEIPPNVYIIGTMNTADRSIALVDQALRRRFAFIRLQPDFSVLESHLCQNGCPAESLIAVLREINRDISDPDCELGISFFMRDPENLRQVMPLIWAGEIEPYLEEVFFDQPERMAGWRWDELVRNQLEEWA